MHCIDKTQTGTKSSTMPVHLSQPAGMLFGDLYHLSTIAIKKQNVADWHKSWALLDLKTSGMVEILDQYTLVTAISVTGLVQRGMCRH